MDIKKHLLNSFNKLEIILIKFEQKKQLFFLVFVSSSKTHKVDCCFVSGS